MNSAQEENKRTGKPRDLVKKIRDTKRILVLININ